MNVTREDVNRIRSEAGRYMGRIDGIDRRFMALVKKNQGMTMGYGLAGMIGWVACRREDAAYVLSAFDAAIHPERYTP